eukprot:2313126-Pleurochrysis_carterae.AAC.1
MCSKELHLVSPDGPPPGRGAVCIQLSPPEANDRKPASKQFARKLKEKDSATTSLRAAYEAFPSQLSGASMCSPRAMRRATAAPHAMSEGFI